jgi:hypothetical protein
MLSLSKDPICKEAIQTLRLFVSTIVRPIAIISATAAACGTNRRRYGENGRAEVCGEVGSRIKVEDDLCRRPSMRLHEEIVEQHLDRRRIVAYLVIATRFGSAQFDAVQCRFASQRCTVRALRHKLAGDNRQHRIVPQFIVVVDLFIAQRDANHPLQNHRADLMLHQFRHRRVDEARSKPLGQPNRPVRLAQQQCGVIAPPSNAATTWRPSTGANSNSLGLHSVGTEELLGLAKRLCRRRTFADSEPRCSYSV